MKQHKVGFELGMCEYLIQTNSQTKCLMCTSHRWFVIKLLFQDPDLEAKRRAELEKIKSQKKLFKQKIQENIERQKHRQLKKKLMKRKQMKKKKAAQTTVWKLLFLVYIYHKFYYCAINIFFSSANKFNTIKRKNYSSWQPLFLQFNKGITVLWWNFTANKIQWFKQVFTSCEISSQFM